jgi:hypothetical protein
VVEADENVHIALPDGRDLVSRERDMQQVNT